MIDNGLNIKKVISDKALQIGFAKIGFAKAEPLHPEISHFRNWLDSGYHAEMKYMERNFEKREDISNILADAKTVIVTATNYYTDFHYLPNTHNISRYAWGDDYHEVILSKLKELENYINAEFGGNSKSYVDTGSILEKAWAVRSGIGWQGKNSLLLTKEFGSYVFLGIIISSLEIEPDKPQDDFCGKCNKCLVACPTKAIVLPKVVDSRKCISFWNIEAKPEMEYPSEVAENLNGRLFGCDICQEVCPWNSKKTATQIVEFYPRNGEISLTNEAIDSMGKEEFSERFKSSPIKRLKLEGLKRNAKYLK